jgi:hypothetical protein
MSAEEPQLMTPIFWQDNGALDALVRGRLIAELNIQTVQRLLGAEHSRARRKALQRVLAKQQAKLAAMLTLSERMYARH